MGRRLLTAAAVVPALVLAGTAAASVSKPSASWAAPEIRAVAAAGLMGAKDVASFRPNGALTAQALENLAFDVKQLLAPPVEPPPLPPPQPARRSVTVGRSGRARAAARARARAHAGPSSGRAEAGS